MTGSDMFHQSLGPSTNDSLLVALFLAAVTHATIILGVNFTSPKPEEINRAIEITLANTPIKKAPKKADFLAQANQIGAGKKKTKPASAQQKLPSQGKTPKKLPHQKPAKKQVSSPKKIITTTAASDRTAAIEPSVTEKQQTQPQQLSVASLQQQIAQLGTEIRQHRQSADLSKIKHLNSEHNQCLQ